MRTPQPSLRQAAGGILLMLSLTIVACGSDEHVTRTITDQRTDEVTTTGPTQPPTTTTTVTTTRRTVPED